MTEAACSAGLDPDVAYDVEQLLQHAESIRFEALLLRRFSWQMIDTDYSQYRIEMENHIINILELSSPTKTVERNQKLRRIAKWLEIVLFQEAQTFEDYIDSNSIKYRLKDLASRISLLAKSDKINYEISLFLQVFVISSLSVFFWDCDFDGRGGVFEIFDLIYRQ